MPSILKGLLHLTKKLIGDLESLFIIAVRPSSILGYPGMLCNPHATTDPISAFHFDKRYSTIESTFYLT